MRRAQDGLSLTTPDLFELLDIILRRETDRAVAEFEATGSWEECMITASRFAREHKRAVYHIYTFLHTGWSWRGTSTACPRK